ncbi:MAG: hypothetical protein H7833_12000 [Magnetococcus sp. DMHC-1]|nr:hypothetical protein [Magnetococcales bacterium]
MEITHLQGLQALQQIQPEVNDQAVERPEPRQTDAGRSAWQEPASTLSLGDGKAVAAGKSSPTPPAWRDAGSNRDGRGAEDKTLPPLLRGGQKVTGDRPVPAKPAPDGILRPWNDSANSQGNAKEVAAAREQIDTQTKAEPVMRAIKEKVDNLFKVYPNGGSEKHAERVPSHPKPHYGTNPAILARKQAVSVDRYA